MTPAASPARSRLAAALLFLALPLTLAHAGADERFLAAREAFRAGDHARLERLAPELKGHELEPYLEYWRISARLAEADPAQIREFAQRHEGSYLAERLRADWVKAQGRKAVWSEVEAEYARLQQPDSETTCYALQARRARGDATVADAALPLWFSLLEPPESCVPVLEGLIWDKRVLADEVWARIRRQVEANRLAVARHTMNYLPPSQTPDGKVVAALFDKPMAHLARLPAGWHATRLGRELAVLAVQRVAKSDPRMAAEQLEKLQPRLEPGERQWAWGQVGWQAATRHMPEAAAWYRHSEGAPLSDDAAEWRVRAALRAGDWGQVRRAIEALPPALAAKPDWIYWLGRAWKAAGHLEAAGQQFARIAGQPNFYGNLADDELERPIVVPPKAAPPSREEIEQALGHGGLRRALALFRVDLRFEATREWNWALRGMSDRELLAAAEVARRNAIFDRAIAAADRTREQHDYSLRYLAPFGEQVRPAARSQSLDDAWVYGLMRQESRFITNAKSSAGASGLMQLMPATARWVAKKIGLKDYHHGRVNDTEVNLLLGTTYMRLVMENLDHHPVLASAAYNAGPGRARKWRAERPLEGAVYAETIPFNETRDYVKKVMSNAVYYAALFEGRPQSLKTRLGTIGPRADAPRGEDLP